MRTSAVERNEKKCETEFKNKKITNDLEKCDAVLLYTLRKTGQKFASELQGAGKEK